MFGAAAALVWAVMRPSDQDTLMVCGIRPGKETELRAVMTHRRAGADVAIFGVIDAYEVPPHSVSVAVTESVIGRSVDR
jgi:hypothetical protein